MSGRFTSVGLFISVIAIALAANDARDGLTKPRGPASVAGLGGNRIVTGFKTAPSVRHTDKLRGPLSVKLEMVGGTRVTEVNEVYVLRGVLSSRQYLESSSYRWSVPADVEVVNGVLSGNLTGLSPDQPGMVELTLRNLSSESAPVTLQATSMRGDQHFGDAAQFHAETQERIEARQLRLLKAREAAVKDESEQTPRPPKVMN